MELRRAWGFSVIELASEMIRGTTVTSTLYFDHYNESAATPSISEPLVQIQYSRAPLAIFIFLHITWLLVRRIIPRRKNYENRQDMFYSLNNNNHQAVGLIDRIYNTPDVSVPATQAILQQIRLERVLRRFGYLTCCKPIQPYGSCLAPPLVTLGPPAPTRTLRPFGAHEAFTGWQKSGNIQIPKPRLSKKTYKRTVPEYPVHAPSQQGRQTIGGCKYGGVHLSDFETQEAVKRVDIFKPFQPLKSPQRLPALQREKPKEPVFPESKIHDTSIQKHIELRKKKRKSELKKLPVKGTRKKKKKRKTEEEFMKWEASTEQYFTKSVSDLHEYVISKAKNHTHDNSQKYREQIETQIKQGVQQRLESFGPSGKILARSSPKSNIIHVLELEFRE